MAKLDLPAKTAGSDPCALRQLLQPWPVRDECIARIFALGHCGKIDAIRQLEWHILHTVNGKIDVGGEQRFVNFLRE
jgi:hypothetical protein